MSSTEARLGNRKFSSWRSVWMIFFSWFVHVRCGTPNLPCRWRDTPPSRTWWQSKVATVQQTREALCRSVSTSTREEIGFLDMADGGTNGNDRWWQLTAFNKRLQLSRCVSSFSFNMWQIVHYLDTNTVSSLPLSSLLFVFSSSACPQTDTAQLYNTHPDSCTHMDRTGLEFHFVFSSVTTFYGTVADMCYESLVGQRAVEKPKAPGHLDNVEILTKPSLAEMQANEERQGNLLLLQDYEQRFEKYQKTRSYPNYAPKQVWDRSRLDNSSVLFRHQEKKEINLYVENIRCIEIKQELASNCGSKAMCDLALSRTWKFAVKTEETVLMFRFNLCVKIKPYPGLELWKVLTNSLEKPCRSKRKRKPRGNPLQKRDELCSCWTEKMDWHWNTGIKWSFLFSCVENHHSTTSTQ